MENYVPSSAFPSISFSVPTIGLFVGIALLPVLCSIDFHSTVCQRDGIEVINHIYSPQGLGPRRVNEQTFVTLTI